MKTKIIVALANSSVVKKRVQQELEGVKCSTPAEVANWLGKLSYTDEHLIIIVGHTGGVEIAEMVAKLRSKTGLNQDPIAGSKNLEVHYFSSQMLQKRHETLFNSRIERLYGNHTENLILFLQKQTGHLHEHVEQFVKENELVLEFAA
ncbi:hypothetical protein KBC03_04860 [Patescibacteria group bacterium]|nr:hypothetical protein [Patescibacteria group bacterium]